MNTITLETYPQKEFLDEKELDDLEEYYQWADNNLTQFKINKDNLLIILKMLKLTFKEFKDTWTWDLAETIYLLAKDNGYIIEEIFIDK